MPWSLTLLEVLEPLLIGVFFLASVIFLGFADSFLAAAPFGVSLEASLFVLFLLTSSLLALLELSDGSLCSAAFLLGGSSDPGPSFSLWRGG